MRVEKLYSVFDIQMQMWTSPVVFRNDTEAKRCFNEMKRRNDFNDCEVEFYCLGDYVIDANSASMPILAKLPRRLYLEDTIDDGEDPEPDLKE